MLVSASSQAMPLTCKHIYHFERSDSGEVELVCVLVCLS